VNFSAWTFLVLFLPATMAGFLLLRGASAVWTRQALLVAASLVFYGLGSLHDLGVLAASAAANFAAGRLLGGGGIEGRRARQIALWSAVGFNVALLFGFKLLALADRAADGFLSSEEILIPLALSFVTFQQIGFVVACYRRRIARPGLFNYLFFVFFFPQLVMGPIVSFESIDRQLRDKALVRVDAGDIVVGLSIFLFGLAKKVLLADRLAAPVEAMFDAGGIAAASPAEAWFAIAAFQLQLFLDFSAYSEMAIGLARMFGVALPINFDRPLSAVNRFDMWRRWHISFVTFMRSHVFRPLVRHAGLGAPAALAATALVSGLWHGLGWTFMLWAAAQTAILLISHYRSRRRRRPVPAAGPRRALAIALTFATTCLLGVLFRSPTVGVAGDVYSALAPWNGGGGAVTLRDWAVAALAALVVWAAPDARALFGGYWTAIDPRPDPPPRRDAPWWPRFALNRRWAIAFALLMLTTLFMVTDGNRFIYVQF
jgi:D-alanyl-lipoteichoic acid acyltransferase DltB (MBOAT superfamily)